MKRSPSLALTAALAAAALVACDATPLNIRNAAPRVTHVGPVTPAVGELNVVFWLQDHESDPTDLYATYLSGAGACADLRARLADPEQDPPDLEDETLTLSLVARAGGGDHRLFGLATAQDFPGQAHELRWDTSTVSGEVCLYLITDDRDGGGPGDPYLSPTFAVDQGLDALPPTAAPPVDDAMAPGEDAS